MPAFSHNADACFAPDRLEKSAVEQLRARLALGKDRETSAIIASAARADDLASIQSLADEIRRDYAHVVVVGAGGSSMGGRVLSEFRPNRILHFLDNIDPDAIGALITCVDLKKTCFIVISKSGATVETLAQFYVLVDTVRQVCGMDAPEKQFIVITGPGDNPLRNTAGEYGMRVLNHEDVGGRFSIFTNVGLLPGAIAGADIGALRAGAAEAAKDTSLPALGAAIQYALMEKGCNISVMLPYAQRLSGFSSWYRQCWAESLGKNGKGSTPIRAVGTTDQHSQLQLYLDGPKDKLFHLITVKRQGQGQEVRVPKVEELSHLMGKTTGDIMAAQQQATYDTLVAHQRPVRLLALEKLAEKELGALLMHFTLEILFMAQLLGVSPFGQPAVEDGKQRAHDALRRKA